MKRFFKTICTLLFFTWVAGVVYSILKAIRLKDDKELEEFYDDDESILLKKSIFEGVEEEVNVGGIELMSVICHFGGMELYLDKETDSSEILNVDVDLSFGGLRLFLPRNWEVFSDVNCIIGGIDLDDAELEEECSTIILTGTVIVGGIEVIYVD